MKDRGKVPTAGTLVGTLGRKYSMYIYTRTLYSLYSVLYIPRILYILISLYTLEGTYSTPEQRVQTNEPMVMLT